MRKHPLMSWRQFLLEWREVESMYAQTVVHEYPALAARARARMRVIDTLLARSRDILVPDCNVWDRTFKSRLTGIVMSDEPRRAERLEQLHQQVTSGYVTNVYGSKRRDT